MQQLAMISVLLIFAVQGYYLMKRLDGFMEENSRLQEEEEKAEQKEER